MDDACGAQLSQEQDGSEFPITFLSHTFLETQRKWSTTEQEAYGAYYAITKWNYYLHGADIIIRIDHKPLTKFWNGKNANNKVNRWGIVLATYIITFEWISGAKNKAADCLSCLVELPQTTPAVINLLSATNSDGPAFNTTSQTYQCLSMDTLQYHLMLYQNLKNTRSYTKIPDSRQIKRSPTDAECRSFL